MRANSGRKAAARRLPRLGLCAECGATPAIERHHIDGDPTNNHLENLRPLCEGCHTDVHRITHCHAGHEFTPANTYLYRGARHCKACKVARQRAGQARRTERQRERRLTNRSLA